MYFFHRQLGSAEAQQGKLFAIGTIDLRTARTDTGRAMSQEKRDLLDRLLLRAPAVGTAISAGTVRLKLGSPLRRRLIHAQLKRGFSAMARSDMDVNVLIYEPDTVVWMHGMLGVGVGDCFRGREGVRALYREIDEAFGR